MSSPQSSPTNTNTTSVANSPCPSTPAGGLNPAEFTKEYLGQQPLDKLILIKKTCGFRKTTKTEQEYRDAIYEWYQKNHAPKPVGDTPKTRKPRAKKVDLAEPQIQVPKKRSIEANKDFLATRTVEQLKAIQSKNNIPGDTEEHSELIDIIYNWYEVKYAAENLGSASSLVDSIRAEVAQDAAGMSSLDHQESTGKGKKKEKTGKMTTKRPDFTTEGGKKELDQYRQSSSSTKEALKERVHQIHNLLRNKGIGYGFNGLKFFNVLWGLKKLEDMNLLDTLGLSERCKFSTLNNHADIYSVNITGPKKGKAANECRIILLGNEGKRKFLARCDEYLKKLAEGKQIGKADEIKQLITDTTKFIEKDNPSLTEITTKYQQIENPLSDISPEELKTFIRQIKTNVILEKCIMDELYDKCREFLYYEMPRDIISGDICVFIREINSLAEAEKQLETKHQLAGKIYEYFIGRDDTAISELGAYFTDRHIVNWIYTNLCSVRLIENPENPGEYTIDTMNDPFGGSGGFTTGYIMRVNDLLREKYPGKTDDEMKDILKKFWETELLKVFHYDMNKDVLRAAALEFMCLTGNIPRTHERTQASQDPNINYKNSFANDYSFIQTGKQAKFKRIITNPPYGGDKIATSDNETKNDLIRAYIMDQLKTPNLAPEEVARLERQIYALNEIDRRERESLEEHKVKYDTCCKQLKDFIILHLGMMEPIARQKFNDKESCSLALLMMLVDVGGEVIGVLKEGVFFDKKYSDLRRKLIELYNVTDVISIPSNAFENTSTKTSILRFLNTPGQPTTTVKFGELDVEYFAANEFERTENGVVRLKNFAGEMKDDLVYRLVSQATKEQILAQKDCSLNGKEYANRDIVPNPGFKMVPLGELVEYQNGYAFKSKDFTDTGVPVIKITNVKQNKLLMDDIEYIEEDIKYNSFITQKNEILVSMTGNLNNILNTYLVSENDKYYVNQRVCKLNTKKINPNYLLAMFNNEAVIRQLNLTKNTIQINVSANDLISVKIPIPENPQVLADWVSRLSAAYNTRLTKEQQSKDLEQQVMTRIREITDNEDCEEVKLGDIFTFQAGKFKSGDCKSSGKYPFYNGNAIQPAGYLDDYCCDIPNYLIFIKDGGAGAGKYGDNIGLGKVFYVSGKTGFTCHQLALIPKSKFDNLLYYMYVVMLIEKNKLMDLAKYTTSLGTISGEVLRDFKIKHPKNKQLITDLEPIFTQIETLKSEAAEAEKSYSTLLDDLKRATIKSMPVDSQPISTPADV